MYLLRDLRKCLWAIPISLVVFVAFYNMILSFDGNLSKVILYTMGGSVSFSGLSIVSTIVYFIPYLVHTLLFGHVMQSEYTVACTYIFPRYNNRVRWLLSRSVRVFILSMGYYLVLFLTIALAGVVTGSIANVGEILLLIALLLLTLGLCNTAIILIMNIVTMKKTTSITHFIFLIVFFAFVFMLPLFAQSTDFIKGFIITRGMLLSHTLPVPFAGLIPLHVQLDMSIVNTVIYAGVLYVVTLLAGGLWIRKTSLY